MGCIVEYACTHHATPHTTTDHSSFLHHVRKITPGVETRRRSTFETATLKMTRVHSEQRLGKGTPRETEPEMATLLTVNQA